MKNISMTLFWTEVIILQTNVLEYLEKSAQRYPDKVAFCDESGEITFSQLLLNSKKIGTAIAEKTGRTNCPIGVVTDRNFRTVEAFMGVLQSGNFYVPIDSNMPSKRLEAICESLSPELILYHEKDKVSDLPQGAALDYTSADTVDEQLLMDRRSKVLDIDPVYVIYTSGSTGTPKGIVISHKSVIDFTDWMADAIGYVHEDIFANQAPFYFDCSVKDLYMTLKVGACDCIIPKKLFMFPTLLIDFLNEHKVTALTWATSGFNLVAGSGILEKKKPQFLKKVAVGGEAMLAKNLNIWRSALPNVEYVNLYGPTEVTVDCTYFAVTGEYKDYDAIPIGKACENKEVLLLDDDLKPVKDGEPGEICVRGTGLSRGYYNEPEKTDAAFVRNPNVPYIDYIYRTGDIGVRRDDGNIVFRARRDGQIKHMGYRIELGEIERGINSLGMIKAAVCFYDSARARIVCVYEGEADSREIVRGVSGILPKYMLPNIYRKIEKMPYNANSKIDRVLLRKEYEDESNH